jgi:mono/diheme cytochrome c family protein
VEFPTYQVPLLGNGMTIGTNAILHVVVSHGVAIGLFGLLLLAMRRAETAGGSLGEEWKGFVRTVLKFTVIVVTTVGAATGAGIWFTTGALAPRAISSLLRVFFWAWFVEWLVFLGEVLILLALYLAWDRLSRRGRYVLGGAYIALALLSAVIITGILGFMLTPGGWNERPTFFEAFLNPSYPPQLLLRLTLAFGLGAVFASAFAFFRRGTSTFQADAGRLFGGILLICLPLLLIATAWYAAVVPPNALAQVPFAALTAALVRHPWLLGVANAAGLTVLLLAGAAARRGRLAWARRLVVPSAIVLVLGVVQFERVREFVRGPYLMPGYMYVNGVLEAEVPLFAREGLLPHSYWFEAGAERSVTAAGAALFGRNCSICHTVGGLNDIRERVAGRSEDGLYVILGRLHDMAEFMPPFAGSEEERRVLAGFLRRLEAGEIALDPRSRHVPAAEAP